MANNKNMAKAKENKNDEYYTQLNDIEKELKHYKKDFINKTVFCNCDDPYESNFFKYFAMNFNHLGLKKLICTCYATSPVAWVQLSLFDNENIVVKKGNGKQPYKIEITEVKDYNGDGAVDLSDVEYLLKNKKNTLSVLEGDGDFRSQECIELLKEADIVVTNPPFSLFREYVAQVVEFDKKFIIIGNPNSLHYKEIFPLIQNNKIWIGYKSMSSDMLFDVSKEYAQTLIRTKKEGSGYKIINGVVKGRAQAIWLTNIDIGKRHEELVLYKKYNPQEYPKYENLDAIEVSNLSQIPYDYNGMMGVPDSFLEFYNPEQFEIVGYGRGDFLPIIDYVSKSFLKNYREAGGRGHVTAGMKSLCYYSLEKHEPKFPFSRIIIRRKQK